MDDKFKGKSVDEEKLAELKEKAAGKSVKDLVEEGEKSKKSFKKHPVFGRKERRTKSMGGARQSKEDPYMMILDQHEERRFQSIKIVIAVFAVGIACVVLSYLYTQWIDKTKLQAELDNVEKKLAVVDARMAKTVGYERDKLASIGIAWTEVARAQDPLDPKWKNKREKYRETITSGFPVLGMAKGENYIIPSCLIDMIHVPQGRFYMGRQQRENTALDELPRRAITIPYEFWMGRTEVSNYQLRAFFPHHQNKQWRTYTLDSSSQPAVRIDWHTAMAYCDMLTKSEKDAGRLPKGYVYRLPTEAEWEYSCRAGTETHYYWGDDFGAKGAEFANTLDQVTAKEEDCQITSDMAPYEKKLENPTRYLYYVSAPVGSFKPNGFGLYDMSGNVWEWCLDWYDKEAYKKLSDRAPVKLKPVVGTVIKRKSFDAGTYEIQAPTKVIRGGGCLTPPRDCRAASRDHVEPNSKDTGIGFRVVLAPVVNLETH